MIGRGSSCHRFGPAAGSVVLSPHLFTEWVGARGEDRGQAVAPWCFLACLDRLEGGRTENVHL